MEAFVPSAASIAALEQLLESLRGELQLRLVCLLLEKPVPGIPRLVSRTDQSEPCLTPETAADLVRFGPISLVQENMEFRSFAVPLGRTGEMGYLVALGCGCGFPSDVDRRAIESTALKVTIELLTVSHAAEL